MHPLPYYSSSTEPGALLVPYAQASSQQLAQALDYLRHRLRLHFPSLAPQTWIDALTLFQPDLLLTGEQAALPPTALLHLAHYLADSTELPVLDPPLHGPSTLRLAQYCLHLSELSITALPELEKLASACGPHLYTLVSRLARGNRLAEEVVQAWQWGVAFGQPLPAGVPGGGPTPGSFEVEQRLHRLGLVCGSVQQ